ncbi:MAG: hypothetical protein GY804_09765 [Alphaproteobacteria bacterium]|nr:hypothetical protein [Alphaproteobacteria bacterium]
MKQLFLAILFLGGLTFGQVESVIDSVTATGTTYASVYQEVEFAVITITLAASTDSILVSVGTNLADSTAAQQEYGQIMVVDMSDGSDVTEITGSATANRKYFVKWGYKQKHIRLAAPSVDGSSGNGATTQFIIEFY